MRRHRLGVVYTFSRQLIEKGRLHIRVACITAGLRPPLRGHDPNDVRFARCHTQRLTRDRHLDMRDSHGARSEHHDFVFPIFKMFTIYHKVP